MMANDSTSLESRFKEWSAAMIERDIRRTRDLYEANAPKPEMTSV
jgi:hypothetical protein